jgi:hypothetical protein
VYDGVLYDSKSEAAYAKHLDLLLAARQIKKWERQVRWVLMVNGTKVTTIIPDFRVTAKDGSVKIVEVKGFATPVWRLKRKLFAALYPDVDYVVVPAKDALAL